MIIQLLIIQLQKVLKMNIITIIKHFNQVMID